MAKIIRQYKHKTIDGVRVVVDIGRSYWFEINKMGGFAIFQWKEANIEEVKNFVKSVDPTLWDKKNHKQQSRKKDKKSS